MKSSQTIATSNQEMKQRLDKPCQNAYSRKQLGKSMKLKHKLI